MTPHPQTPSRASQRNGVTGPGGGGPPGPGQYATLAALRRAAAPPSDTEVLAHLAALDAERSRAALARLARLEAEEAEARAEREVEGYRRAAGYLCRAVSIAAVALIAVNVIAQAAMWAGVM